MKSSRTSRDPTKMEVYLNTLIADTAQYRSQLNATSRVIIVDESRMTMGIANAFKSTNEPLGVSVGLHPKDQSIIALAVFDAQNKCLVVEFSTQLGLRNNTIGQLGGRPSSPNFDASKVRAMIQEILCQPPGFYAFDLGPLALALYRELGIRVADGIDIQSVFPESRKTPADAISAIIGSDAGIRVDVDRVVSVFEDLTYYQVDPKFTSRTALVQRAWISQFLAGFESAPEEFQAIRRIDTTTQSDNKLLILSKWAADSVRLQYMKPLETEHSVTVTVGSDGAGSLDARSSIYKNKLRRNQNLDLTVQNEHGTFIIPGNTGGVVGRRAPLNISRELGSSNQVVGKILSKGRDILTNADEKKAAAVLRMLQGEGDFGNIWVTNIWDPPNGTMSWPKSFTHPPPITVPEVPNRPLNSSQIFAIAKMLSLESDNHIILIRGPPGSGKTSVISRFVEIATASPQYPGLWLIAQSNVAVKNIAEKLASIGYMNWKLLVSRDFIFDWHEHLYGARLQNNLISSDQFFTYSTSKLAGCKVILCTLSMLSNSQISKFSRYIPIHTLIVDEASQIEVGNFLPVLFTAVKTLQKLCFIGDDKQYRMPPQMGDFISSAVYDGDLKSNPNHVITDRTLACQFIHVPGVEIFKGNSFINTTEALAVIKLAAFLEGSQKSYRIITPYDSQRNYIEELMKEKELDWHDKCFNVDSFQGNEDNFIIISIVRSDKPGFLTNLRRTNVMLTRFKRGMFIVTSKKFITGPGAGTLVAQLADYYKKRVGDAAWLGTEEIGGEKMVLQ
ncbi:hypothetical protein HHX47_DHR7000297 [Lentinula edodes]|nr:hypothetical protein HHX47_DHR7000297 [Lentinula edodes]